MIEEDVPGTGLICFSPNHRAIGCARIGFAGDGLDAANDHRVRNRQNQDHRQHDRYHMSQAKIPKPNQRGDKCADGDDRAAGIGKHHATENGHQCQQRRNPHTPAGLAPELQKRDRHQHDHDLRVVVGIAQRSNGAPTGVQSLELLVFRLLDRSEELRWPWAPRTIGWRRSPRSLACMRA